MGMKLLRHGQSVPGHFEANFTGLGVGGGGRGQGKGFKGWELETVHHLQCWSAHITCLAYDPRMKHHILMNLSCSAKTNLTSILEDEVNSWPRSVGKGSCITVAVA